MNITNFLGKNGLRRTAGTSNLPSPFWEYVFQVLSREDVPYFTRIRGVDFCKYLTGPEKSQFFEQIFPLSAQYFAVFRRDGIFSELLPEFDLCYYVPQDKNVSKNVFDHTVSVINNTMKLQQNDQTLYWSALFHDLGKLYSYQKYNNFIGHEHESTKIASYYSDKFNLKHKTDIVTTVQYHMKPLQYQRIPDWSDRTIKAFVDSVGGISNAAYCIELAKADKKAEHPNNDFSANLDELMTKVICLKS